MPEIKVPTADGRGLFFEIAGTEPSAAEKDFITGHVQNYNSLYGPPPPAPPPPVEEMGPWRAGLMNLYADIDTAIGGGAQALGYDDAAQRYYQAAGETREDVAKRYKPIDLYDVQGLGTGAQFVYENLASSAAYLLPMALGGFGSAGIAAGLGATRAGIGLAGAVGSAAGGTGPYTGQMASRQAEEQGVPLTDVDWGKALAYGTVASSLDLATPAVLGVFGKLASRVKMGDKAAKDIAEGWFRRVGKNAFKGLATEAPIETAQQALEIFQANPEKFYELGPEVQKELITAFVAGGTIGGIMGGALGGYDVGSDTYRESDEEKKKSAQILLDIEKMQASSENAAKIAKMRDEYQRALAEEKQFESEDLKDLSFGLDTPRYSPSDDMARYRPEVITSYDGTAAGYRVASPTGDTISYHDSFDAARFAAQTANDSAAYSPSIMESFPVIPVSSLEASTREELVKKRYEMGQAGLDNNTSLSEIRNLLGDGIASIERERLTGSPQIPLRARLRGESPRVKPAQAPLETQWRQFVSPEVERMLRAVSAASPAPAAPVTVVSQPTPIDPQTATPTKKDPVVSTPPVKEAAPWGEEVDLDGTGDEDGFTFQKGDLGGIDYAKRRRRIKEKAEAATSPDTAANTPSPTGPRFTVEAVDATTAEPDGTNPRAMYDIFRDGKKAASIRGLAEATARAEKMQADNPTGSVVVRPKNKVFAVNEYRGSAQGDVFVSTIRTFRDQKAAQDYVNTLNEVRERRVKQRIANRDAIQRYENLLEKQKAAWQIAERRLKQMGAPPDLIVRVRGVLEDPNTAEADTSIEGYYDASAKLMAISIDIWGPDLSTQELADRIAGVINHEFVHVLQRAGVFDKKDWKTITKYLKSAQSYEPDGQMVKGQTWWERSKNMAPPDASNDLILREAMSEAFRSWVKNKSTVTGKPASIFRRIVEVIKTLGGFAKSNPRIEQIFKEIDEGKRSGVLKQGTPADAGAIDFSGRKSDLTAAGGRDERVLEQDLGRGRGGRGRAGGDQGRGYSPLPGAPVIKDATGPDPNVVEAARSYAESAGIPFRRQAEYAKADPERGRRIADAYEKMPHAPQDPKVREAYEDLKRQTRAQYEALIKAGYEFTFYDQYADPYGGNPMNAIRDLRKNKRMAVYGTYDGYGTEGVTGAAIENNPMLEDTGLTWPDQNGTRRPVTANDLFRAVHDAFGHSMEGAGFRADGEENAWQAHIRLYTGPAIGAATSELRGQNSWLNFGPYGEKNAKANVFDTVFAEQKTGLMPEWTWREGIVPDEGDFIVPEEVRKPNGDIDFSKRNLILHQTRRYNNISLGFEDETGKQVNDQGVMVEYEVRLKDKPGGIGLLHGSIARGRPDLFYVEYASFDPDDMSIEETVGLINLLGKNFPKIRYITGQRISGARYKNREKRLRAAEARFKASKVVFANDIMTRARASKNPEERAFFMRHRASKDPEFILDAAARLVPDLYEQDTAASREASLAEDRMFDAEALSVRQTINVGRMRDRGLVDFSRRLVNTPEFKAWFKDSKVVNPDGSPMIVYHNTDKDFDTFKTSNSSFGAHFGTQWQADFFTRDTGSRIIPAFLSIKNPVRLIDKGTWGPLDVFTRLKDDGVISLEFWKEATDKLLLISKASPARSTADYVNNLQREILVAQEQLMAIGVDGIVYLNRFEGVEPQNIGRAGRETDRLGRDLTDAEYKAFAPEAQDSYIAFRPTQIKSALGNRGTFSSEDPRIDFSRRLVNTPEFKAWFRNSQAINDDGTPTVLYHATAKDFDAFKAGGFDPELSGKAIWLTDNAQMQPAAHNIRARTADFREGTRVLPLFARIERPLVIDTRESLEWARDVFNNGRPGFPMALTDDAIRLVKEEGYDGIIFHGDEILSKAPVKRGREVVVFEPNQLKSAVGNRGTFSVSDDRIDFSRRKATIARVEKKKVEKKTAEERAASLAEKFQKNPDLFEVVTNVYGEVMRVPRQITDGLPELRRVIPYLREDELNTNIIGGRGILEMFENAPDATEMAAVAISGRAKRGWYEQSARALIHVFGIDDAPRFSALLAGLSPQTKVEDNAKNALNMWVNWDKAGRPTDRETIIRILGQSVQGKKGEGSILDAWKNNSVTALQAIDPHAINISGNKVNSFMLNLNDVVHAVTNDAWMANYGDVDQNKFSGSSYHGYSAKVRMSAEIASELTGYNWTPREIQETVWSWAKTVYELRKKLGKAGGDQTVGDLLRAGRVTNAMIANTPDFATLFTDGVYRGILERGGYNNQIERIISDNRIAKGSRQLDAAFGARSVYDAEGAGIAPADYRRYLDTAAARLEQRYQRRKAEAAAKKASGGRLTEGEDSDVDYSRRREALAAGYTDPDPKEAALVEKGIAGRSFDDALDWLAFTAPTQDYRYIAGGVQNAIRAMKGQGYSFSIKVAHVGDQVPSPLLYARGIAKANFDKKTVEVWLNGADVTGNVGMSYETLLHEMIHAATMAALRVGNKKSMANTKAGKLTSNLYDLANAIIKEFNERVRTRGVDGLSDFERKVYKRANNATQNVDEILTWGLTNREMQAWLDTIPYKNQTLWSRLVDMVRSFLGLAEKGQTALSEVLRIGDSLLQPDTISDIDLDTLRVARPAMPMVARSATPTNRDLDFSRRLVQTLEFKDWFGNSKVVGSDGQPLVMFHGTSKDKDFVSFNVPRNGAWFTGDIDLANDYAETNDSMDLVREPGSFKMVEINTASRVMPVYLSIQNPYRMTPQEIEAMDMAPDKGNTPGYKAWQKDFFTDLRRRGHDGVEVGNGTWVVLDSPTQIKSAIGNRGTFSKDNKRIDFSRVNPLTPADIANSVDRIRYTGVRNMLMNSLSKLGKPIGLNEARARSVSNAFIDNFTDHALPIGEIVDQVREKGGNISDAFDAMLKQQLWSSKAEKLIERMNDNFYQPMIRAIRALQISDADIADFKRRFPEMSKLLEGNKDPRTRMLSALMYGRHAPERNLVINAMNQGKLPNGSGVSTAEAEAVVKWFESRPNWNQYKLAEQAARRIIEETNNIRVAAGLTPDFRKIPANPIFQKLGMPNGYRYYAPLRGVIEEDTMPNDIDLQRLRTGRGLGTKGPEDISAKGRMEMANNIVEHIILQNEVSAVRSTKNEVNRAFYDLVKNNQAMLKDVAEIVTKAPMIRRIGDDGIVRLMPDMNYMNSDEYHITKIDGENHVIRVKDARLARTLNGGTGYGDEGIQHIVNLIGGFTRFMSQMATGLNPEFWLRNTPRDVLTGAINIKQYEVEGGVSGLSQTLVSNWPTALKAARRANRFDMNYVKTGDERVAKPTDPVDVMYQEFMEDGGFTGYLGLQTIETKIANLNKQITKGENSKLQEGLEVANRFKEFVEAINNSFENATRFAVYKTLRDTGFTRERAAQAAKTVTTNFNAGGWYKNLINPFYMFYNASIQGSMAILTAGVRSPKVRSALAAILVGGVMQDLVGSMLSDEDESGSLKYDKVKEWMARTHMIIPDPTGMSEDGFVKVPLPFGFNAVYNFGRVMSKYLRHQVTGGDYDLGKATASALGTLIDATNPLGASQSFINYVAPTILDPVVALTINRDFDDSIIVKRPISNVGVDLPSSQMYLSSTSPIFVGIADFLNTYSGGTTVMPGQIDFSPDAMQYLFDYFLSGAGAFARRSAELAAFGLPAALQGDFEGMTPNKVPFVRAVVGSTSGVDMDRYLEIREEVLRIGKEAKEASLSGNIERLQSVRENYPKELQVYGVVKGADSQRQSIAKRIAAIKGNDRIPDDAKSKLIQQLKEQEKAAMLRAIRAYNTVVEGMSVPPMERPQ